MPVPPDRITAIFFIWAKPSSKFYFQFSRSGLKKDRSWLPHKLNVSVCGRATYFCFCSTCQKILYIAGTLVCTQDGSVELADISCNESYPSHEDSAEAAEFCSSIRSEFPLAAPIAESLMRANPVFLFHAESRIEGKRRKILIQ